MRVRFNVDFELSPRVKRMLKIGVPVAILLVGSVVYANVPNTFKDGDPLSAQTMNDNFTTLDTRLAKLEALSAKETADGGFSVGATFCGATSNTPADLSSLTAIGVGYPKARAQCVSTCGSATAHMCSGDELTRASQLGAKPPAGWYSAGSNVAGGYECLGWTNATASYTGTAWSASPVSPSQNLCNTTYPVLCCD